MSRNSKPRRVRPPLRNIRPPYRAAETLTLPERLTSEESAGATSGTTHPSHSHKKGLGFLPAHEV